MYLKALAESKDFKMQNQRWLSQTSELNVWLNSKGYKLSLETDAEDCVDFNTKTVHINSRNHPESRYYTLLHECGHILISQNSKRFDKEMPMYARSNDGRSARSKAYRVSTVAEELEAWKRGRRLSYKLNHFINESKFDKQITDNVMSYIEWASDGGGV